MLLGEAVPSRTKKQQNIGFKSFYSNTCYGFEYNKTALVNCQLKSKKKKTEKPKRPSFKTLTLEKPATWRLKKSLTNINFS